MIIMYGVWTTRVKTLNLFPVDENRLQQCCAAPHEQCCQQHVAVLLSITRCNNIVDNNVHGVQHNIVEACSHQPGTTCTFLVADLKYTTNYQKYNVIHASVLLLYNNVVYYLLLDTWCKLWLRGAIVRSCLRALVRPNVTLEAREAGKRFRALLAVVGLFPEVCSRMAT